MRGGELTPAHKATDGCPFANPKDCPFETHDYTPKGGHTHSHGPFGYANPDQLPQPLGTIQNPPKWAPQPPTPDPQDALQVADQSHQRSNEMDFVELEGKYKKALEVIASLTEDSRIHVAQQARLAKREEEVGEEALALARERQDFEAMRRQWLIEKSHDEDMAAKLRLQKENDELTESLKEALDSWANEKSEMITTIEELTLEKAAAATALAKSNAQQEQMMQAIATLQTAKEALLSERNDLQSAMTNRLKMEHELAMAKVKKEKDEAIFALIMEKESLQRKATKFENELSEMKREVDAKKSQALLESEQTAALRAESETLNAAMKAKVLDLEKQMDEGTVKAQAEVDRAKAEIDKGKEEVKKAKQATTRAREETKELQSQLKEVATRLQKSQAEFGMERKQAVEVQEQLRVEMQELEHQHKKQMLDVEDARSRTDAQYDDIVRAMTALEQQKEYQYQAHCKAVQDIVVLIEDKEKLLQTIDQLEEALQEAINRINGKEEECNELNLTLGDAKQALESTIMDKIGLESKLKDQESVIEDKDTTLKATRVLYEEQETLEKDLKGAKEAIHRLTQDKQGLMEALEWRSEALERKDEELDKERQVFQKEVAALLTALKESESALATAQANEANYRQKLIEETRAMSQKKIELAKAMADLDAERKRIDMDGRNRQAAIEEPIKSPRPPAATILPSINNQDAAAYHQCGAVMVTLGTISAIKEAFYQADVGRQGRLDAVALGGWCASKGMKGLPPQIVHSMISSVDVEGTGFVDFWGFLAVQVYISTDLRQQGILFDIWLRFITQHSSTHPLTLSPPNPPKHHYPTIPSPPKPQKQSTRTILPAPHPPHHHPNIHSSPPYHAPYYAPRDPHNHTQPTQPYPTLPPAYGWME